MNRATLKALKGSIAKWEAIVAGTGADSGADNCPLCEMFAKDADDMCIGCPVRDKTGKDQCDGSPYLAWRKKHDEWRWPLALKAETPEQIKAAKAELRFLKSLLPKPVAKKAART